MEEISFRHNETIPASVQFPPVPHHTRGPFTDEELYHVLNGCKLNQRAEQKELYSKYYSYAMLITLRYSSNYENAVEMINDTFLKIFKEIKKFEPRFGNVVASFTGWIKCIIICTCIDHIRKYKKKETLTRMGAVEIDVADQQENAEQILQYKEIIKCIQQLSPVYKKVFSLYAIEGFSHLEIARRLKISEGTSKSNLYKARQNLLRLLEKDNCIRYAMAL